MISRAITQWSLLALSMCLAVAANAYEYERGAYNYCFYNSAIPESVEASVGESIALVSELLTGDSECDPEFFYDSWVDVFFYWDVDNDGVLDVHRWFDGDDYPPGYVNVDKVYRCRNDSCEKLIGSTTVTFDTPGTYEIPVIVEAEYYGEYSDYSYNSVTVNVIAGGPPEPVAQTTGPYEFCPNESDWFVSAENSYVPAPDSSGAYTFERDIVTYEWDVDTLTPGFELNGQLVDVKPQLAQNPAGNYEISVTVTDNADSVYAHLNQTALSSSETTEVQILDATDTRCGCISDLAIRGKMLKAQLTWTDTSAYRYGIYRKVGVDGQFEFYTSTDNRYSTFLDTGLELGETYYYQITELDELGRELCYSDIVEITPSPRRLNTRNAPPVVTSTPVNSVIEAELYEYDVNASDPDLRDRIEYTLFIAPQNMTIDIQTGLIQWVPNDAQVGLQQVVVRVTDTQGAVTDQLFEINVINANDPPVFESTPSPIALAYELYEYQLDVYDIEGDSFALNLNTPIDGLNFDTQARLLTWTPVDSQIGNHNIEISALDSAEKASSHAFVIEVMPGPNSDVDLDGVRYADDICKDTQTSLAVNTDGCPDTDSDGVFDNSTDWINWTYGVHRDLCPNTPVSESVDFWGCSSSQKDEDNDGYTDNIDLCPETNGQPVDSNGCAEYQKDDDNDGVRNPFDLCPNTTNYIGIDSLGCAADQRDSDGDGIVDSIDADIDGDGVDNSQDAFPENPTETLDTDNDGIGNNEDADDDSDGYSDLLEIRDGTDPLDWNSNHWFTYGSLINLPQTGERYAEAANESGALRVGTPRVFHRDDSQEVVFDRINNLVWQDDSRVLDSPNLNCAELELAGRTDWRLPNRLELLSLVRHNQGQSFLEPAFKNFLTDYPSLEGAYRAVEPSHVTGVDLEKLVDLNTGFTIPYYYRARTYFGGGWDYQDTYTRCVSGTEKFIPSFERIEHLDISIDHTSNLMFEDGPLVQNNFGDFDEAVRYCQQSEFAGFNDWRIPNVNESHILLYHTDQYFTDKNTSPYINHAPISDSGKRTPWVAGSPNYSYVNFEPQLKGEFTVENKVWAFKYREFGQYYSGHPSSFIGNSPVSATRSLNIRCVRSNDPNTPRAYFEAIQTYADEVILNAEKTYVLSGDLTYRWFVGNDLIAEGSIATVNNLLEGLHSVKLVVTSESGKTDSYSDGVLVTAARPQPVIVLDESIDAYEGNVVLDATQTQISNGEIVSYRWFIDGTNFVGEGETFVSTSIAPGLYDLTLQVETDLGAIASKTVSLRVLNLYTPTAIINASDVSYVGHVYLSGAESFVESGSLDYQWSVDGSMVSTSQNISLTQLALGTYDITLTVAADGGVTDSQQQQITVVPVPLQGEVFPEDQSKYLGFVELDARGIFINEDSLVFNWFIDGTYSGTGSVYAANGLAVGTYNVELQVETNVGLLSTYSYGLEVQAPHTPTAIIDGELLAYEYHVTLDATQSYIPEGDLSYEWFIDSQLIGEGAIYSPANLAVGTYNVMLVVTSEFGQSDSAESQLTVRPRPVPVAIIPDSIVGYVEQVVLDGSASFLQAGSMVYEWFIDGTSIGLGKKIVPDLTEGNYSVTLTVTTNLGLTDSYSSALQVLPTRELITCPVTVGTSGYDLTYPEDDLRWSAQRSSSVDAIEEAFNAARLLDPSTDQFLIMPSQNDWDAMTPSEQALYLINAERQARGIKPYAGVTDSVISVAQNYASYILENNETIDHYLQGTPSDRLLTNSQINEFASLPSKIESLNSSDVTAGLAVAYAIYDFIYNDKYWYLAFGLTSGNSWGHRDHMLLPVLNEDHGGNESEGLIGVGLARGFYKNTTTANIVVINSVDPLMTWDESLIRTVDTSQANGCVPNHNLIVADASVDLSDIVSLEIEPSNIVLNVGDDAAYTLTGTYADGSEIDLTYYTSYLVDNNSIVTAENGLVEGIREGATFFEATANGVISNRAAVYVSEIVDTTIFNGSEAEVLTPLIPSNASFEAADPYTLAVYTGLVLDRDGFPMADVQASLVGKPEYGTVLTDAEGRYIIAAQAGPQAIVFEKPGYLTIQRNTIGQTNTWTSIEDVMLLPFDTKETYIDLSLGQTQVHESSIVSDEYGTRKATVVFNDITEATVIEANGNSYALNSFWMSATEYETPESMPGTLPQSSAFTYCTELHISGLRYNDTIIFDNDVVMFVDNFLGFDVGEIVPVGYFDQIESQWVASKNGVVVQTIDADGNGIVDGIDHNADGIADDLNGNGTTEDDAFGLENYAEGATLMWGAFNHFTPVDYNLAPEGAQLPNTDGSESGELTDNCEVCPTGSYVKPLQLSFHEDIPLTGTGMVLHYSSQRTADYKHEITTQLVGNTVPDGVVGLHARLEVGGQVFTKEYLPIANTEARFLWDGTDINGKRIPGYVNAKIRVGYEYTVNYSSIGNTATDGGNPTSFFTAWDVPGTSNTGVPMRQNLIMWQDKGMRLKNTFPSQIAEGWSLNSVHELDPQGQLYLGGGQVQDVSQQSILLKTGQSASFTEFDDGHYQSGGQNIRYAINSDGFVVDEVTGLIWENAEEPKQFTTLSEVSEYCQQLPKYSEYRWRTPTTKEISYSTDKSGKEYGPYLYFMDNAVSLWHSSVANPDARPMPALCVSSKNLEHPARTLNFHTYAEMVRDTDNEVVVDNATGLMWQDTFDNESVELNWQQAIDYCEAQTHAGFNDWRLPNINEYLYALPNSRFDFQTELSWPNGENWSYAVSWREAYWSSTSNAAGTDTQAWAIESDSFNSPYFSKDAALHVRCVRTANSAMRLPYVFNAQGQHIKTVDLTTGKTVMTYEYDEFDQLVAIKDRFGNTTSIERAYDGQPTAILGTDGQRTMLIIDGVNNLQSVIYEDGSNFQFAYDGSLLTEKTDPNGNKFPHFFDQDGRVTYTTDSEGGRWDFFDIRTPKSNRYGYTTAEGNLYETVRNLLADGSIEKIVTRENGSVTVSTVSENKMSNTTEQCGVVTTVTNVEDYKTKQPTPSRVTVTQPSGLTQTTYLSKTYGSGGADTLVYTTTATQEGNTSTVTVDGRQGITTSTSSEGRISRVTRDPLSNLVTSVEAGGLFATNFVYDDRGRVLQTQTGTRVTDYYYNDAVSNGQLTSVTTPDNRTISYEYDVLGRVRFVTYPDGHRTETKYDDNGNATTIVVPTVQSHGFEHNGVNKVDRKTQPLSAPTTYIYDNDRRLTGMTLPSGQTISHTYENGKKVQTQTPEGTRYYSYICGEKLTSINENSEWLNYGYDGDLLTEVSYEGVLDAAIGYTYNSLFQIQSTNYAGKTETYGYDSDGLATQIGEFTVVRNESHGLPERISDSNQTQNFTFNGYGELKTKSTVIGNELVFEYELEYDDSGSIVGKTETLKNGETDVYVYGHDIRKRLISVIKNGTEVEAYDYDENGNRERATSTLRGIENQSASYNDGDQLEAIGGLSYTYDANGRLRTKTNGTEVTTYTYSSTGQLLSVELANGDAISYQHNALGNRVAKLINGQIVEKYLWRNKTTLLAIYDRDDNLLQRFEYGLGHTPTVITQDNERYYVVTDQIGSPRIITDESGTVIKEIEYDSYGNVLRGTNDNLRIPFGFAGGFVDSDTGLLRFGYRDYDANTGRWTARDPIGFAGGDTNLYGYVSSNPIQFIDPDGLRQWNFLKPRPKGQPYSRQIRQHNSREHRRRQLEQEIKAILERQGNYVEKLEDLLEIAVMLGEHSGENRYEVMFPTKCAKWVCPWDKHETCYDNAYLPERGPEAGCYCMQTEPDW